MLSKKLFSTVFEQNIFFKKIHDDEAKIATNILTNEYKAQLQMKVQLEPARRKLKSNCNHKGTHYQFFLDQPLISNPLSDAIIDIREYLEKQDIKQNGCPFKFWELSNSKLKEVALKRVCIPATSMPSERIFSKAGLIMTDRRNILKEKHWINFCFLNKILIVFSENT